MWRRRCACRAEGAILCRIGMCEGFWAIKKSSRLFTQRPWRVLL
jgi:hypothetical protein